MAWLSGRGFSSDFQAIFKLFLAIIFTVFSLFWGFIEIKLDFPRPELEEYDNKLMFYFPHDDVLYDKVKVVDYE